jgi:hypothetical protein
MGGVPGLDVPLARTVAVEQGCLIDYGTELSASAKDSLSSPADDEWRRCIDGSTARIVACSQPHTGESLATGEQGKASQDQCDEAAGRYMGRSISSVSEELRVQVIKQVSDDLNGERCVITVRGTQPLTASVRRLGVSRVPIG